MNKWRRSGKISRQHFPVLAELTGLPLTWWLSPEPASDTSWGPWPFADWVDYTAVAALPTPERRYLALCLINGLRDLNALSSKNHPSQASHKPGRR